MFLIALNEAFDKRAISLLLLVGQQGYIDEITGDGVVDFAPLAASGLVEIKKCPWRGFEGVTRYRYQAFITDKGRHFLEAWKSGDQTAIAPVPLASDPNEVQSGG
jgi:hypothetical protein